MYAELKNKEKKNTIRVFTPEIGEGVRANRVKFFPCKFSKCSCAFVCGKFLKARSLRESFVFLLLDTGKRLTEKQ